MKKKNFSIVAIITISVLCITNIITINLYSNTKYKLEVYKNYYNNAEDLLNSLEKEYNWVDAIDHSNYYNALLDIEDVEGFTY